MQTIRKSHPYDLSIDGTTILYSEVLRGWSLPGRVFTVNKSEAQRAVKRLWRLSRGEK